MNRISKNSVVSPKAKLGDNITIKDFAVVEDDVVIGDNTVIEQSAVIKNGTTIGKNCKIYNGAILSQDPQDFTYTGQTTTLTIGDNTTIREYVTISKGTVKMGKTTVGENNYIMAYCHIAHDCKLASNIILVNSVEIAGHVEIDDWVYVSTLVGIHQFVRIGKHSLITYLTRVSQDVPPFIIAGGYELSYMGLNIVGLRRRGFDNKRIGSIKQAYDIVYNSKYNVRDALNYIKDTIEVTDDIKEIISFIESSERGIVRNR
jgi:UDP-N-acetylglucosamine acyltransferase